MAAAKKATKKASTRTASKKTTKKAEKKGEKKTAASKKKSTAATSAAKKAAPTRATKASTTTKKSGKGGTSPASGTKSTKKATANKSVKKSTTKSATKKSPPAKKAAAPAPAPKPTAAAPAPLRKKTPVKKKKLTPTAVKATMKELPKTAFSPSTGTATNAPFSKKELAKFSEMIHSIRENNVRELEELGEQLREMAANEGAEDNTYSLHMAEQGTDAMEREKTFLQAQRTSDYIKKLDEALLRIQHENFGICRICGLQLDSRRLMAVPVTQVCTVYKNTSKPCIPGKHFIETFGEEEE